MKIELSDNLLFKLILITPLTMQIQRMFDAANRVSVGLVLIVLLYLVVRKCNKQDFLLVFLYTIYFMISWTNINAQFFYSNMLFFFPLWYLYLVYTGRRYIEFAECIQNNLWLIKRVVILWSIIVIISAPLSSSYIDFQFRSFTQGPFRLAPTALMIAVLIWIYACETGNKKFLVWILVPFISIAFTGCRSYTIIMLIFAFYAYYGICEHKIYFYLTIIPVIALVAIGLSQTSFIAKFEAAINNPHVKDPLIAITSGRSLMWTYAVEKFRNANIFIKLFGGGLTHSYEIFYEMNGSAIWAHNDLFEMLNCHGIVGVILYIYVFVRFTKKASQFNQLTKLQFCIFIGVNLVNACINGLYVYNTALLTIPFLWHGLSYDFAKIKHGEEI